MNLGNNLELVINFVETYLGINKTFSPISIKSQKDKGGSPSFCQTLKDPNGLEVIKKGSRNHVSNFIKWGEKLVMEPSLFGETTKNLN